MGTVISSNMFVLPTLNISGRDFIAPCKCKGTSKYVHRECLDHWRAVRVMAKDCFPVKMCSFRIHLFNWLLDSFFSPVPFYHIELLREA